MFKMIRALLSSAPEIAKAVVEKDPEPQQHAETGVLFGLDPPEDHYFKVERHDKYTWCVWVRSKNTNRYVSLGVCGTDTGTTENTIKTAASRALSDYERGRKLKEENARYEGCYPPKRTG